MSLKDYAKLFVQLWQRKGAYDMAAVYATLIIKGRRTFASVPDSLKEQVREILIDLECEFMADETYEHR